MLLSLRVVFTVRVMSYKLLFLHELRDNVYFRARSNYLLRELSVTFYIRVTSYFLSQELRVASFRRVTRLFVR